MIVHEEIVQRTPDWFAIRIGRITGTQFKTMAAGKPATIEALCWEVATEKHTGHSSDGTYTNQAMLDGIEREASAREAYEFASLVHVQEVGFLELDEYLGVSPDGLVSADGGVEIKCPEDKTHARYLVEGRKAWYGEYRWQIQGALWVSGREWWDFVSWNPFFPDSQQLLVERVLPDAECREKLEAGAAHCRKRIAEIVKELKDKEAHANSQG